MQTSRLKINPSGVDKYSRNKLEVHRGVHKAKSVAHLFNQQEKEQYLKDRQKLKFQRDLEFIRMAVGIDCDIEDIVSRAPKSKVIQTITKHRSIKGKFMAHPKTKKQIQEETERNEAYILEQKQKNEELKDRYLNVIEKTKTKIKDEKDELKSVIFNKNTIIENSKKELEHDLSQRTVENKKNILQKLKTVFQIKKKTTQNSKNPRIFNDLKSIDRDQLQQQFQTLHLRSKEAHKIEMEQLEAEFTLQNDAKCKEIKAYVKSMNQQIADKNDQFEKIFSKFDLMFHSPGALSQNSGRYVRTSKPFESPNVHGSTEVGFNDTNNNCHLLLKTVSKYKHQQLFGSESATRKEYAKLGRIFGRSNSTSRSVKRPDKRSHASGYASQDNSLRTSRPKVIIHNFSPYSTAR